MTDEQREADFRWQAMRAMSENIAERQKAGASTDELLALAEERFALAREFHGVAPKAPAR